MLLVFSIATGAVFSGSVGLSELLSSLLQPATIAMLIKPKTNDVREASSRVLMEQLWQSGAAVQAFDPEAMEEIQRVYGVKDNLTLVGTKEAALKNADALIICTEWQQFKAPDFDLIKQQLKQPVIFDGRNLYEPERMLKKGFIYYAIGRGESVRKYNENH